MMKRILIALALVACVGLSAQTPAAVKGQPAGKVIDMEGSFLRQVQERDSILIADQLDYGFLLKDVEEGTGLALPDFKNTPLDSILTIVREWKLDTLKVYKHGKDKPKSYDIEASIRIAAFDEGQYVLPPLSALRMGAQSVDTLRFKHQEMEVCTMPVDTATFQLHDIKGQIRYPVTFKEMLPYIAGGILLVLLIVLIVFLVRKYGFKSKEAARQKEPAHIIALRELDKFRGSKYWAPEKQKIFYSGITDALRAYIAARYEVSAMEKTTAEIFTDLKKTDIPASLYDEMKELFETSDFVKFAKLTVSDEDNAKAVPAAVRFVTETYQTEIDKEAEESANKENSK